jgi:formate dehydrogenase subunit delta
MTHERMVTMANQIATYFRSYPHETAVDGVATHIRQFWEKRMRAQLLDHVAKGGEGLEPLVIEAAARLQPRAA